MASPGFITPAWISGVFVSMLILHHTQHVQTSEGIGGRLSLVLRLSRSSAQDVLFILDRSTGVGPDVYHLRQQPLAWTLVRQYMHVHAAATRLGFITFAADVRLHEYITGRHVSKCDMLESPAVKNLLTFVADKQYADGTNLASALQKAGEILEEGRGNRPDVVQTVVVFTDGEYNNGGLIKTELRNLIREKVEVYSVGVGVWMRTAMVQNITSDTSYFGNFSQWISLVERQRENNIVGKSYVDDISRWTSASSTSQCNCGEHAQCQCDSLTGFSSCVCEAGYERYGDSCVACQKGYYRAGAGNSTCAACPVGMHTKSAASTARNQCQSSPGITPHDPCEPNPCGTGEKCAIDRKMSTYNCECPPGSKGSTCSTPSQACPAGTCQNGALCASGFLASSCICTLGYTGRYCEINVKECQLNLCVSANTDTCTDKVNDYHCNCRQGYSGRGCQDRITSTITSTTTTARTTASSTRTTASSTRTTRSTIMSTLRSSLSPAPTEAVGEPVVSDSKEDGDLYYYLMIFGTPAGIILIALISSVVAVVGIRRARKRRRTQRALSDYSEPTSTTTLPIDAQSVTSSATMMTFGSNVFRNEGIPVAPPGDKMPKAPKLSKDDPHYRNKDMDNFKTGEKRVYGNTPNNLGMEEWVPYVMNVTEKQSLRDLCIVRMDGEKWVVSPGGFLVMAEYEELYQHMRLVKNTGRFWFQGKDYEFLSNQDACILGHRRHDDGHIQYVCATKSRQYFITGTSNNKDMCEREVRSICDYVKKQGL